MSSSFSISNENENLGFRASFLIERQNLNEIRNNKHITDPSPTQKENLDLDCESHMYSRVDVLGRPGVLRRNKGMEPQTNVCLLQTVWLVRRRRLRSLCSWTEI
jgi:hypothetical protein